MGNYLYGTCAEPLPDIYGVYTQELQQTHPFIAVCYRPVLSVDTPHIVIAKATPIVKYDSEYERYYLTAAESIEILWYRYSNGVWGSANEATLSDTSEVRYFPQWTGTPIYNEDGTLYLAASDPVPVSPVQINPALLVQSFFVGQALRRNRT